MSRRTIVTNQGTNDNTFIEYCKPYIDYKNFNDNSILETINEKPSINSDKIVNKILCNFDAYLK
jgi:hypothetical protein